jgi:hypothetical protein
MNERIKELAEQAGVLFDTDPTYTYGASPKVLERFAELVRQDEREKCAKECEKQSKVFLSLRYSTGQPWSTIKERFAAKQCAAAIRGRTE